MDTRINLAGTVLDNPVIPASGTFGYGWEFSEIYDINCLGTFSSKARPPSRASKTHPRIADSTAGMINPLVYRIRRAR